jgi:hypothetical protein
MNIIGTAILKRLVYILSVPEENGIDYRKAKMGKVAHIKGESEADAKRLEAVRQGVEHLRKLKEQMEKERYQEEMKVYERIIKDKKKFAKNRNA